MRPIKRRFYLSKNLKATLTALTIVSIFSVLVYFVGKEAVYEKYTNGAEEALSWENYRILDFGGIENLGNCPEGCVAVTFQVIHSDSLVGDNIRSGYVCVTRSGEPAKLYFYPRNYVPLR